MLPNDLLNSPVQAELAWLRPRVESLTNRLNTLNRRRQAHDYRRLLEERDRLALLLLPGAATLTDMLTLLSMLTRPVRAVGYLLVRARLLHDPNRYIHSLETLSPSAMLLLEGVFEGVDVQQPEAGQFIRRVRLLAGAAYEQIVCVHA
ncbi:hypothetical protein [Spirosoma montaniterrae]|uniref:Uncharacterized protein n=1 Tax=Spirosoma montaniterrae TaxID=1178516 RepID=A0A1P9WXR1_9BACT|nr:hypothetical protein [Spirosoma montaniterrae]AQG80143.1 hypothetical protein AWR27_12920 [Spirosoma montaniterrae]